MNETENLQSLGSALVDALETSITEAFTRIRGAIGQTETEDVDNGPEPDPYAYPMSQTPVRVRAGTAYHRKTIIFVDEDLIPPGSWVEVRLVGTP